MEHKLLKPHIRELVQSTRILLVVKYTCHNSTSWHRQTNKNRYRWGEEYTGRDGVGRGKARKDINSVLKLRFSILKNLVRMIIIKERLKTIRPDLRCMHSSEISFFSLEKYHS